jgi:hypothetical protein
VVEELDGEVLVYDTERDRAHCLNGLAAAVWNACDGRRGPDKLTAHVVGSFPGCDEDAIAEALAQLGERHLLSTPFPVPTGAGHVEAPQADDGARLADDADRDREARRLSRRRALRTIGIGVAAGIAFPVITSITAPTPAHAFSCVPTGGACSSSAQCCSGACASGSCL